MKCEIVGTLKSVKSVKVGNTADGKEWRRGGFLIEYEVGNGYSNRDASFVVFGNNVDFIKREDVGKLVKVGFLPTAHEYNGSWYCDNVCISYAVEQKI